MNKSLSHLLKVVEEFNELRPQIQERALLYIQHSVLVKSDIKDLYWPHSGKVNVQHVELDKTANTVDITLDTQEEEDCHCGWTPKTLEVFRSTSITLPVEVVFSDTIDALNSYISKEKSELNAKLRAEKRAIRKAKVAAKKAEALAIEQAELAQLAQLKEKYADRNL